MRFPPPTSSCWQLLEGSECTQPSFVTLQVGVLNWFARLWEIDEEEYYGYITTCGTEGNLHGIYVGRENLPDGILYASTVRSNQAQELISA